MVRPDTSTSSANSFLVPRFVRNLEAIGRCRGFFVSIHLKPVLEGRWWHQYGKVDHLIGYWRGTRRGFVGLKFAVPGFRVPLLGSEVIMRPNSPIRSGTIEVVDGKYMVFSPDFGRAPIRLEERGDVEVVTYEERIAYHGGLKALVAMGIPKERLTSPRTRRWSNGSAEESFGECHWEMRRQPDGSILYVVDTEAAETARQAAKAKYENMLRDDRDQADTKPQRPSYLTLVVDNDSRH